MKIKNVSWNGVILSDTGRSVRHKRPLYKMLNTYIVWLQLCCRRLFLIFFVSFCPFVFFLFILSRKSGMLLFSVR